MESSSNITVVEMVLEDFFAQHSADVLLGSLKILKVLIENASTKSDPKYKCIDLSKPKIQAHVVNVKDAMHILSLAGFVRMSEDGNWDQLYYTPSDDDAQLSITIRTGLERKLQELQEQQVAPQTTETASTNESSSPFLSHEERQKRQEKARQFRKAQQLEREAVQRRWQEDKEERLEVIKRKEQLAAASSIAHEPPPANVSIRQLVTGRRIRKEPPPPPASVPPKSNTDRIPSTAVAEAANSPAANQETKAAAANHSNNNYHSATKPPPAMPPRDAQADELWKSLTKHLALCEGATGIRDTSVFKTKSHPSNTLPVTCLKRLYQEIKELSESLPNDRLASIWLRFDEETPQYLRALMSAPLGTPYAGGLFCFDIFVPNDYPNGPPRVVLLTTGGGRVRFGPNLYADGKVCLSLLGTWPGPKWSPSHSNLYQVLVSIQGLVLGAEQPWFLEPGHGGWEGDVKEGDFIKNGQTLAGQVVRTEVGLPPQVQQYNTVLRVGTVRFAMLEALSGPRHLKLFDEIIRSHFFCNRRAIQNEVRSWPCSSKATDAKGQASLQLDGGRFREKPAGDLKDLLPKLEQRLASLNHPQSKQEVGEHDDAEEDRKMAAVELPNPTNLVPAKRKPNEIETDSDNTRTPVAPPSLSSKVDVLRADMKEAASAGNYDVAGRLQEQLNHVEDLERRIQQAASEGNFIRAGRLQEQMAALLHIDAAAPASSSRYAYDSSAQDEEMNHSGGTVGSFPNVFAPPSHPSGQVHHWGSGNVLSSMTTAPPVAATWSTSSMEPTATNVVIRKAPPPVSVCRLRFRLPESKVCLELFDRNDPLSSVYCRLESIMSPEKPKSTTGSPAVEGESKDPAVAPPLRTDGAWAQPQSSSGFTLLLSHPKREFNLEMHGTKTLMQLGLAPAATLTIMKTSDRGLAYRGEVENRLTEAQGDAMDIEGLTYEGLLELTERIGVSKTVLSQETLDENTTLLSPSNLDMSKNADTCSHCPICLGEFDMDDERKILRKLNHCSHIFHAACLATWLGTKSSCPCCKTSIVELSS